MVKIKENFREMKVFIVNSTVIMYTVINVQNVALFCDEWQKCPQLPSEALSRLKKKGPWNEQELTNWSKDGSGSQAGPGCLKTIYVLSS